MEARLEAALTTLLREILDGPAASGSYVLNPGDPGLLASLDRLSPEAASARPGGRSSVAAHVEHLRYGLGLLNRWGRGDDDPWKDANYAESWRRQTVNEAEWRALRDAFTREARDWAAAAAAPRDLDEVALNGIVGSVVHLAYHLGAIRQLAPAAAGPPAQD